MPPFDDFSLFKGQTSAQQTPKNLTLLQVFALTGIFVHQNLIPFSSEQKRDRTSL